MLVKVIVEVVTVVRCRVGDERKVVEMVSAFER